MNSPQKLQDAFEDAYFAILMDAFAESEGEQLLAESKRLAIEPMELPEGMDERIIQAIDREYRRLRWKKLAAAGRRTVTRVAVVVLAVVVLFTTLCVASSAFRERVLNIVQEWNAKYTGFRFEGESDTPAEAAPHKPYWLPDGYEMISSEKDKNVFKFEDQSGSRIFIFINDSSSPTTSLLATVDTEDTENVEEVTVHHYNGLSVVKNGTIQLVWGDTDHKKIISVVTDHLSKDETVSVAESMYD